MLTIKVRRAIFAVCILLALVWNVLCLLGMFPIEKWAVSLFFIGLGSLFTLIPLLFHFPKVEASSHISELNKHERMLAGTMIALASAWAITTIACIVYPL